jgi:bacteriorhodopsin
VGRSIAEGKKTMGEKSSKTIMKVFWLMMFAWALYPIAYLIPVFMNSADGVVLRQLLFTIADISSKVIYGLMITYIALDQSAEAGYLPAQKVLGRVPIATDAQNSVR